MPWKGYINSYKGAEAGVLLVDSAGVDDDVGEDMCVFPKLIPPKLGVSQHNWFLSLEHGHLHSGEPLPRSTGQRK